MSQVPPEVPSNAPPLSQSTSAPQPSVPPLGHPPQVLEPHRGTLILVFGILSWMVCFLFGITAWVMANRDLREMAAGRMDRSGESMTQAGRILGMINVILTLVAVGVWLLLVLLLGGAMCVSQSMVEGR
jgi:hypothetical protein